MRFRFGLMVSAVALAGSSPAQDPGPAPPFPVQNDLSEGWDMGGADMPIDVLGVKIGMPREAAVQAVSGNLQIDPNTIVESAQEKGISDQYGTSVFFKYVYWWNAATASSADTYDSIQLSFSTGISGERVTGLTRRTQWKSNAPRLPDLEKALTDKYGTPSFAFDGNSGGKVYYWGYYAGQKVALDDATGALLAANRLDPSADGPGCLWNIASVASYDYEPEAQPGAPERRHYEKMKKDCSAVMVITLAPDSSAAGLVNVMELVVQGPKRIGENFIATDAFLDTALADAIANSSGGAPAPKL